MSKKIAAGANKIVLDVTCGSGAFMKTVSEARELSRTMIDIGKLAGKETVCVTSFFLGTIHCYIGMAIQLMKVLSILRIECNANRGGEHQFLATNLVRRKH